MMSSRDRDELRHFVEKCDALWPGCVVTVHEIKHQKPAPVGCRQGEGDPRNVERCGA